MARDYLNRLMKVLIRQGREAEAIYRLMEEKDYFEEQAKEYIKEVKKTVEAESFCEPENTSRLEQGQDRQK